MAAVARLAVGLLDIAAVGVGAGVALLMYDYSHATSVAWLATGATLWPLVVITLDLLLVIDARHSASAGLCVVACVYLCARAVTAVVVRQGTFRVAYILLILAQPLPIF